MRDLVYNALWENYEVLTARDGHEAMRVFELHRKQIAAVLTDLRMRHEGG